MELISGTVSAVLGALTYINALVGEGWTRYFLLLAGLFVNSMIGGFTGIYAMEGVISFVVSSVFGFPPILFPVHYGISSLTVIFIMAPLMFWVMKFYIVD